VVLGFIVAAKEGEMSISRFEEAGPATSRQRLVAVIFRTDFRQRVLNFISIISTPDPDLRTQEQGNIYF